MVVFGFVTMHIKVVIGLKVLCNKSLCHGLAYGHVVPRLDPDVTDVAIRPLVDSNVYTAEVETLTAGRG